MGALAQAAGPLNILGAARALVAAREVPLKIGLRAASLRMVGDPSVIQVAAGIPGIQGVELQVTGGEHNLRYL